MTIFHIAYNKIIWWKRCFAFVGIRFGFNYLPWLFGCVRLWFCVFVCCCKCSELSLISFVQKTHMTPIGKFNPNQWPKRRWNHTICCHRRARVIQFNLVICIIMHFCSIFPFSICFVSVFFFSVFPVHCLPM